MDEGLNGSALEALVDEARAGSRAAFAMIYRGLAPEVARTLTSFAGADRALLDDLVQDVFVRVAERLDRYRRGAGFRPWLFTIALNVGRNHARRTGRERTDPTLAETLAASIDPRSPSPDDLVGLTDLTRAVAQLPEEQREVVALRVGADLDYETIAKLLDVPVGTARRRMHDAARSLRARLSPDPRIPTDGTAR